MSLREIENGLQKKINLQSGASSTDGLKFYYRFERNTFLVESLTGFG